MQIKFIQKIIDFIRGKNLSDIDTVNVKDKIICVGDSHVNFFSGNEKISFRNFKNDIRNCNDKLKEFATFHLGPALAYNLNKSDTKTRAREKIQFLIDEKYITERSVVLLCFGEIDCRVHAVKQAEKENIPLETVVEKIVKEYLDGLDIFPKGCKIYLWSPVASGTFTKELVEEFPSYGTCKERNRATELFGEELKKQAEARNVGVLSIFKNLIDGDYNTIEKYYSKDKCHISQKAWKFAKDELMKIEEYRSLQGTK